jgi:signal-transduction protein with cAMP-binding, CBS, and nucleotidyltransferase domain
MDKTFVNDIMNENVVSIEKSVWLAEAAKKMDIFNIGCLIVTENSKPIGIVTERDFVTKMISQGRPLFTEISNIMSSPLITISSTDTVWEAAEIMKEKGIHKLPVEKNEQIVGMITTTDIVQLCSLGSDSEMRKICDQILLRMKNEPL